MKIKTFKGGIHPEEMKELAQGASIEMAFPKSKTVTIPITMGGAPNAAIVKVGDVVKKGQMIATGDKPFNCPVHSSVSGTVKKITNCTVTGNAETPCIVIEANGDIEALEMSDGHDDETDYMTPLDPFNCEKNEALERIKNAGIVGMGGASFPCHIKLNPPPDKKIEYVLLNAAECEPYLTCDERTLQESPEKVVDGLMIVQHIVSTNETTAKAIIALEDNKASIQPILQKAIDEKKAENVSICLVKTKYPQGSEKFIVSSVLGREIPSAKLPADAGCIISNVGTVVAISDAFRLGKPLIERTLTISGLGVNNHLNLRVPIGTLVSDLMPEKFEMNDKTVKILSGGPMMGFAMANANFPIAKGTSGVTFLTKDETTLAEEENCIGCGKCIEACPMHLSPVLMVREMKAENYAKAKKIGLMDCIECGSCAYVCPAHIALVQRFRLGKGIVRGMK